jgi:hypothetical protein
MRRGFSTTQTTSTSTCASSIPSSGTNGSHPLLSATMYMHKSLRNKNSPFVTKDERGNPSRGTTLLHQRTVCCCALSYNGLTRASLPWMIPPCSAGPTPRRRSAIRSAGGFQPVATLLYQTRPRLLLLLNVFPQWLHLTTVRALCQTGPTYYQVAVSSHTS